MLLHFGYASGLFTGYSDRTGRCIDRPGLFSLCGGGSYLHHGELWGLLMGFSRVYLTDGVILLKRETPFVQCEPLRIGVS